jgi:hypothetical protein
MAIPGGFSKREDDAAKWNAPKMTIRSNINKCRYNWNSSRELVEIWSVDVMYDLKKLLFHQAGNRVAFPWLDQSRENRPVIGSTFDLPFRPFLSAFARVNKWNDAA